MLSVALHMRYTDKVSEEEMTSPHSRRPLATYVGVLGGASAATDALSPSRGLDAALSSSCNLRAALSSLCDLRAALSSFHDLRASPSTGVCRD